MPISLSPEFAHRWKLEFRKNLQNQKLILLSSADGDIRQLREPIKNLEMPT
jgi:hypothetical protein